MRRFFSGPETSGDERASVDVCWKPEDLLETGGFLNRVGEGMVKIEGKGGRGRREDHRPIIHPLYSTWAELPFTCVARSCCLINVNNNVSVSHPQAFPSSI
jgi:hypothetical protein